ncbi:MAG TPA: secretin N-terminal domain-containing protein [Planctomycetota bacterium]|nr:secretin N-terminal domain-containing protein [Planctomycetota bacterium]
MHRWTAAGTLLAAFLMVGLPGWAQDPPAGEKRLDFKFRDASVDKVLEYVCRQMKWTLTYSEKAKPEGTITAYNESLVPEGKVVDFLNTALQKSKVQVFLFEEVLKVVTEEEAKKGKYNIDFGDDPTKIPINDTMRTWIYPLRNVNIDEIEKKLKEMIEEDGVKAVFSPYSNSVVMTGKGASIYRVARILKIVDVQATERLEVRLFKLRHADAQETAKLLNDVFKKPEASAGGGGNPWAQMAQMMGGGGQRTQGPQPRSLASEMFRLTADVRTNAVVATATKENLDMVDGIIKQLDGEAAEAVRLKLYPLRYADAKEVAAVITRVFEDEAAQSRQANRNQRNLPIWMGGSPQIGQDPAGATREVRAVSDVRSNSVVVAANEGNLRTVDDLIANLDRQLTDILRIKIYELKNADPTGMVNMLREMFRPQITATQNAGRPQQQQQQQGNQNPFMFGNRTSTTGGSSALAPSMEMEITGDTRTRSVIVKASEDYIAVIDEIVSQLDRNPTETMSTYVIDLRNAKAADVAQVLQQLLRGGSTSTTGNRTNTNTNSTNRNANTNSRPATRQSGGASTRNLGPLSDQDPTPPAVQQPPPPSQETPDQEEARRAIEGQADVQADAATNSLVVRTSPRNLEAIRSIVQNLDRARPQVLIKVLIAEVTLDKDTRFGVEGFWENKFRVSGAPITQRHGTDFDLPTQGLATLLTGKEMKAALNAFADEGKLKVLATPRILVLDNETANINVGKEVPRITNSTINELGNTVNTVQYESVGILLEVTPHINFDGLVTMDVHPEISDIAPASEAVVITPGATSPTFNVNYANTTVAARTGQTVVIGGLIRESESNTVSKVPILGDIPILGFLFSNTIKQTVKRELMIFLTPLVSYTSAQLEEITELEKAKLKLIDDGDVEDGGDRWLQRLRN